MCDSNKHSQLDDYLERSHQLQLGGQSWGESHGHAWLEHQIANCWPANWGDHFCPLIYGDFEPPEKDLEIPALDMVILCKPLTGTVIRSARTVLRANVFIADRSIDSLSDAVKRVNVLLGAWTWITWGNAACGWWSKLTHEGKVTLKCDLDHDGLRSAIECIKACQGTVARKVESALYWMRAPATLMQDLHQQEVLAVFAGLWNAFECLVGALNDLRPLPKLSKSDKQAIINSMVSEKNGNLSVSDVELLSGKLNPNSFKKRARHALDIVFGDKGEKMFCECFEVAPKKNCLYQIRNDINHGNIEAERTTEISRVSERQATLRMIVTGMLVKVTLLSGESP